MLRGCVKNTLHVKCPDNPYFSDVMLTLRSDSPPLRLYDAVNGGYAPAAADGDACPGAGDEGKIPPNAPQNDGAFSAVPREESDRSLTVGDGTGFLEGGEVDFAAEGESPAFVSPVVAEVNRLLEAYTESLSPSVVWGAPAVSPRPRGGHGRTRRWKNKKTAVSSAGAKPLSVNGWRVFLVFFAGALWGVLCFWGTV